MPDDECMPVPAGPQGQHVKHSPECDGYTSKPTYVRIYHEWNADHPWWVDGADGLGHYTDEVLEFDTFEEAVAAVPDLIKVCGDRGMAWQWDTDRPLREVPSQRVIRERTIHA